jgi:hypothetical protein
VFGDLPPVGAGAPGSDHRNPGRVAQGAADKQPERRVGDRRHAGGQAGFRHPAPASSFERRRDFREPVGLENLGEALVTVCAAAGDDVPCSAAPGRAAVGAGDNTGEGEIRSWNGKLPGCL